MAVKDPPNLPKEEDISDPKLSPEERLKAAASSAQAAIDAQKQASSLRSAAAAVRDPKKREKLLTDAYNKEIEAHGESKKARVMRSGAFQGAMGGGGIGAAVGAGLGTVVGTVVGTVTTIPTTAVGVLVGSGVGAMHGPWIKLSGIGKGGGKGEDKKEGKGEDNEKTEEEEIDEEDACPNPDVLRQAADMIAQDRAKQEKEQKQGKTEEKGGKSPTGRKKPRKIEIRNKQSSAQSTERKDSMTQ